MTTETTPGALGSNEGLGLTQKRAAFERWTRAEGGNLTRHADNAERYASATVQGRWLSWAAAWDCQQASIDRLMLDAALKA